ncbi:hypothetical protein [Burkholderia seminalis]|uniref:GAP1-N1 domain-containing protein n=1 Tax=Burkholderia seminalis TaxID=488731 RepID=UPI001FC89476|nr:hypothetical protein [Burkholderia seminalis]
MPEKPFKFDQVVHGYRDGHRLLATSVVLDVEAADAMALTSDLLTSRSLRPTEHYITAYPLKSGHKYVIACTWPAPEMSRPGCVWTHSLILDYVTVSKIDDADFIVSLFRRPNVATLPTYGAPLTYDSGSFVDRAPVVGDQHADSAVRRVYGMQWTNCDILLDSYGPSKDTRAAFALWSQMPPRLRRTIAFCTEPSVGRLTMDAELTIRFSESITSAIPATGDDAWRASDTVRGIRLLAKDLTRRSTTPLRRFLRRFSVDVSEPLYSIPVLAEVFLLLHDALWPEDFAEVARLLGRAFANRRDAQLLKQDLLLGRFFEGNDSVVVERRVAAFLGTLRAIDRQDLLMTLPDDVQLAAIFKDIGLTPNMLTSVMDLYRNPDLAEMVEACVRHAVPLIPVEVLATLPINHLQAIEFARLRPELLRRHEFWQMSGEARKLILQSFHLDAQSVSCYLEVFRDTLDAEEVELLADREPEAVLSGVSMLWQANLIPLDVSKMIVQQLGRLDDLLPRLILKADSFPRAVWSDIGHALASQHGDNAVDGVHWSRILNTSHVTRLDRDESTLAALLFVRGMASQPAIARTLLGVSFDVLYMVAWSGGLTSQEQLILNERLPGAAKYWSWDYCKRLSLALLDAAMRGESWEGMILATDVSPQSVGGIVREIEELDDALGLLRSLSVRLDHQPGAQRKWGKAVDEAIKRKTSRWPFW